jgi:hypothetical protein
LGALFGTKLVLGLIKPKDVEKWILDNASGRRRFNPLSEE